MYSLSSYSYPLPEDRIAQHPLDPAHDAKLLLCEKNHDDYIYSDHQAKDFPKLLHSNTLLVANNSQVFAARIPLHTTNIILSNGNTTILQSGEIFIVRVLFDEEGKLNTSRCIIRGSDKKHFKPGSTIILSSRDSDGHPSSRQGEGTGVRITSQQFVPDGILVHLHNIDLISLCDLYGDFPLPPYITQATHEDKVRYKTSFGSYIGSVATPTAGLHFTPELRKNLIGHGHVWSEITLHVGIGTFAPVVADDIRDHELHSEYITIPTDLFHTIAKQKINKKPIITIGTTSTRTIESLPYLRSLLPEQVTTSLPVETQQRWDDLVKSSRETIDFHTITQSITLHYSHPTTLSFSSSLFIYPGFHIQIIDGLITNFHLPQTSLVMLVAGLMGYDNRKKTYQYALANQYRFASFGDAMCILF